MPEILQTSFLAGFAALAVPVLIHLFFRLRTKRVELGTIRFLRIVLEENARRRKVMRWFLLALRLACIALLVSLFARPYLSEAAPSADKELIVLLIDDSATMHMKGDRGRPIDEAVAQARELIQKAGDRARVEVAFFDHRVRPVHAADTNDAAAAIEAAFREATTRTATFGATSYGAAMAWARDVLVSAPHGKQQLHLFTDMQRSGLDYTEVEPLPPGVATYLHDFSKPVVNNVAVSEIRNPRSWIRPADAPAIAATVLHGGTFALDAVPVTLEIGRIPDEAGQVAAEGSRTDFARLASRITKRERVKLEPGASVTINFEIPELAEGEWQGRVTVEYDDDLSFDNQRYFAISATPPYKVLVVRGDDAEDQFSSETHFLEAALRLAPKDETYSESPFSPDIVSLAQAGGLPALANYPAVVLVDLSSISAADAAKLASYVRSGGRVLVFTGEQTTSKGLEPLSQEEIGVGTIGGPQITRDLPWRIAGWDEKHRIFAPFNDPQYGDLRRLIFAAYTKIEPASDARFLATFSTGDPLILERNIGEGSMLWVTTSCGREWGDWTRSRLYLPIVHQLLGDLVGLTAGGRVRSHLVDAEKPDDTSPTAAKEKSESSPQAIKSPGIMRFAGYLDVTNSSPRESETESCTAKDFEDRFAVTFADDAAAQPVPAVAEVDLRKDELWHWVACALLGVLLLEGFVGNRTTA
jgi:hypothetical protein